MSIFDKLFNKAANAASNAVKSAASNFTAKKEEFTFARLPESLDEFMSRIETALKDLRTELEEKNIAACNR